MSSQQGAGRLERYVKQRRTFYGHCLCQPVNNPASLLTAGEEHLWNSHYPNWEKLLSEDAEYPVAGIAKAVKDVVRGEEDVDIERFERGAQLLLGMEKKYKPRDILTIDTLREATGSGTGLIAVVSEPTGRKMLTFRFGSSLWWKGYGDYGDWDPELVAKYMSFDFEGLLETPEYRDDESIDRIDAAFARDPEMGVYRHRQETNPEWLKRVQGLKQWEAGQPSWNASTRLFLIFRGYLQWDRRFVHLGVCRQPGCEKLYVKSRRGWSTQRYCSRHKTYHRKDSQREGSL